MVKLYRKKHRSLSEWPATKRSAKRRMARRTSEITKPTGGFRRLGALRSKRICLRAGCGQRISKLSEKFDDPYCSRVCMALDKGLQIKGVQELFSDEFKKGAKRK